MGELRSHPVHPLRTKQLYDSLGLERSLDDTVRTLRHFVQGERPPVVGAMHVTCCDEAQRECIDAFDRGFVRDLLPCLKLSTRAPFRLANLGARHEWGAVRICENHFAAARGAEDWKLILVKVDAHVSIEDEPGGPRFGWLDRYDSESPCCGALHAMLDGATEPFAIELADAFGSEDEDRLGALTDPARVDPRHRALFAAAASARLQARRAMIEVQDHGPRTPTLFLVVPCVTLNRRHHDTEILCGVYTADRRGPQEHDEYCGLGDLPWRYRLRSQGGAIALEDDELPRPRRARDHRALVLARWRERGPRPGRRDPRLATEARRAAEERRHHGDHTVARALLRTLLALALEAAPIPAAVLLFGEGLVHIRHAHAAHRLAREAEDDAVARAMLADLEPGIDALPPERAEHLVELLIREYR